MPNFKVEWYDTSIIPEGKDMMKTIKWKVTKSSARATVGGMRLSCSLNKTRWYAGVYCMKLELFSSTMCYKTYKTLKEAQEEAVRLACGLLLYIQTCLNIELKNFGLEPGDEE